MYKAVFLDLDGTLLDEEKNISIENKKAIEYARMKGTYVIICSGRQVDVTKRFKELAGADRYIIFSNGAGIYDCIEEEILFSSIIENEVAYKIYELVCKNKKYIRIDTKYGRYINGEKYRVNTEITLKEDEMKKFFDENEILQISIGSETEEVIDEIAQNIINEFGNIVKIENRYSLILNNENVWIINIINKNASKGNAISGLCKYLKIDTNEAIACGDDLNDISMMKNVGLGIAMGNAIEIVKKNAKEITKTNVENGVAEVLLNKI